jgi:hypothetical protein
VRSAASGSPSPARTGIGCGIARRSCGRDGRGRAGRPVPGPGVVLPVLPVRVAEDGGGVRVEVGDGLEAGGEEAGDAGPVDVEDLGGDGASVVGRVPDQQLAGRVEQVGAVAELLFALAEDELAVAGFGDPQATAR